MQIKTLSQLQLQLLIVELAVGQCDPQKVLQNVYWQIKHIFFILFPFFTRLPTAMSNCPRNCHRCIQRSVCRNIIQRSLTVFHVLLYVLLNYAVNSHPQPWGIAKTEQQTEGTTKNWTKKLILIHVNILCNILILFCTKSDNEVEVQSRA